MVDPTGLKPAPHGLKGRRSVTRAPGQRHCRLPIADRNQLRSSNPNQQSAIGNDLAVAEGFEPSIAGLTIRCLTNLATPQENWLREQESNLPILAYETSEPPLLYSRVDLAAATRVELVSSRLQDERSGAN
jgi:hypothetical protein